MTDSVRYVSQDSTARDDAEGVRATVRVWLTPGEYDRLTELVAAAVESGHYRGHGVGEEFFASIWALSRVVTGENYRRLRFYYEGGRGRREVIEISVTETPPPNRWRPLV